MGVQRESEQHRIIGKTQIEKPAILGMFVMKLFNSRLREPFDIERQITNGPLMLTTYFPGEVCEGGIVSDEMLITIDVSGMADGCT
jgi:hypothetical protein